MSLPALARPARPRPRTHASGWRWDAGARRSRAAFPWTRCSCGARPGWDGPRKERRASAPWPRKARALRRDRLDLALDLQGDLRASFLLWISGASRRVGYANTGGDYLLTDVVPLDETVSWVEQNRRAVALAVGGRPSGPLERRHPRSPDRRRPRLRARRSCARPGFRSAGRSSACTRAVGGGSRSGRSTRWREVAARLQREHSARRADHRRGRGSRPRATPRRGSSRGLRTT